MVQREVFWSTIGRFTIRGIVWGIVLGGAYGTFILPIIGTVFGAFYGGLVGYPLGTLNGLIMAVVGTGSNVFRSRQAVGLICAATSLAGSLIGFALLFQHTNIAIFAIPSGLAAFSTFATTQSIALINRDGPEKPKNKPKRNAAPDNLPSTQNFLLD